MQSAQDNGGPLEDHLRNLILGSTDQYQHSQEEQTLQSAQNNTVPAVGQQPSSQYPAAGGRPGKKRPNQAQRRQMSAQLNISVDPRPVTSLPGGSYTSSPGSNQHHGHGLHQRQGGSYSAGGRGNYQPHPLSGAANTQQSQHRQQHSDGIAYGNGWAPTRVNHSPHHQHQRHHPNQHQHHGHRQPQQHALYQNQPPHLQQSWPQSENNSIGQHRGSHSTSLGDTAARPTRKEQGSRFNPGGHRLYSVRPEELSAQSELLDQLCANVVQGAEIDHAEIQKKEDFRAVVENICRSAVTQVEAETNGIADFPAPSVELKPFGSLSSGFATKAADMDLGLFSPLSIGQPDSPDSPIPRVIEKALLDAGFGARLLTKTRVPIIKLCEHPTDALRRGLLEARSKWERGVLDDDPEANDDHVDLNDLDGNDDAAEQRLGPVVGEKAQAEMQEDRQVAANGAAENSRDELLATIKQHEKHSLAGYYSQTKRALRRLGGCDVSYSNVADFTTSDSNLLDEVVIAFVKGLHDQDLRQRVSWRLTPPIEKFTPTGRTLHGVYTIIEGESLLRIWESRMVYEADPRLARSCMTTINAWKFLLQGHRPSGAAESLAFNRDLHLSVERLRQIPSIQFMQLQQAPQESPTEYYQRVVKLARMLTWSPPDLKQDGGTAAPVTVPSYIAGIRNESIRKGVEEFVRSSKCEVLKIVARRHKSLHLAAEYERVLEKGLYSDQDGPAIQQYITILRQPFVQTGTPRGLEYALPQPDQSMDVLAQIRHLQDPSRLAPRRRQDRYDDLEFPGTGVGVQCDINFSAHLAVQNSLLLRCYSYTDSRVRPIVLFVKHWAKARDINTPYRGTLSSYGYVLMVLHYLVNIATPFVCPNLQLLAANAPSAEGEGITTCKGHDIRFWRDEQEIQRLAHQGLLNQNRETAGSLLRGFFEYFAQSNTMSNVDKQGFDWGRDALSLRTPGGLVSKQKKGWTGARTTLVPQSSHSSTGQGVDGQDTVKSPAEDSELHTAEGGDGDPAPSPGPAPKSTGPPSSASASKAVEFKEVRHRYLFSIEDPFELDHNVARTVTHPGIVAIRDEFRRAWRVIKAAGRDGKPEDLLENVKTMGANAEAQQFEELLKEIHGVSG